MTTGKTNSIVLTEGPSRAAALCCMLILAFTASRAHAQVVPAPPIPTQLTTASKIFLASAGAANGGRNEKLVNSMVYTSVYHALSSTSRYQLQGTPADAELSFTISGLSDVVSVQSGSSLNESFLRLEIKDIKTNTLLWAVAESVEGAFREKTFQKNVDSTVAALIADLNSLAAGKLPGDPLPAAPPTPQLPPCQAPPKLPKTRISDAPKN